MKLFIFILLYLSAMSINAQPINIFDNAEASVYADSAAKQTLAQLSLKDKIKLLSGSKYFKLRTAFSFLFQQHLSTAIMHNKSMNDLPDLIFTDGPRGITTKPQTNFPAPIARACTWNISLEEATGNAMALEAVANGANLIGAPCINLLRHPSNGRAQESYGEDVWLVGSFGAALVKGIQEKGIMACVKHYALNSIENTRYHLNVHVDERTLHEVYLPHFKKCIDAGAASVMTAYNKVNDAYCAENIQLSTILFDVWEFKGFTQSDWDLGVRSTAASVKAQLGIEMPEPNYYKYKKVKKAIDNNELNESDIDKVVYRTLFTRHLFHHLYKNTVLAKPDYAKHSLLAKQIAAEGTVLLKNENNILPFDTTKIKSILLTGRLANAKNDGDVGSSGVKTKVITPLQAFKKYATQHNIQVYFSNDKNEIDSLAKKCDAVIIITGLNDKDEGEYISVKDKDKADPYKLSSGVMNIMGRAGDRYRLSLSDEEIKRIQQVATLNKKTVAFLIGGSAITMEEWKNNVNGIFFSGYHGMNGAETIPEILFGNINPGGKLAFTIPVSEKQLPEFPLLPKEINYDYYHGYTLLDKNAETPSFPFGFGLSYTSFEINAVPLNKRIFSEEDTIEISVNIKNKGNVNGTEVIQAYVHFDNCKEVERAVKLLKAFEKVSIAAKEEKTITLKIPVSSLAYYDVNTKDWKVEKAAYSVEIAASARDQHASLLLFDVE